MSPVLGSDAQRPTALNFLEVDEDSLWPHRFAVFKKKKSKSK